LLLAFGTLRVAGDDREPGAVRRPVEIGDAAREARQRLGLAAVGGHDPDLRLGVLAAAVGEEGDPLAVRADRRLVLVRVRRARQRAFAAAVPARAPQVV